MVSRMLRTQSTNVLLIFVAAGFALLLGELLMLGHTFQVQIIAVGSAAVGLILSLAAFVAHAGLRRIISGLFLILALIGLYGFFIHMNGRARRQGQLAGVQQPEDRLTRRALTSFSRNPPLVPPLALSGLSALAVVTLLNAGADAGATQTKRQRLATGAD